MLAASIPPKFPIPFANGATVPTFRRTIPTPSQIGIQNGAASLTDGFPPANFTSVAAGGVPPFGEDFNGLLFQITQWLQYLQAGGPVYFDASFSTSIGGYPAGAVLSQANKIGGFWISLVDNNTNNPDAGATTNWGNWNVLASQQVTGDCKWRPTAELVPGWVRCNFLTIGDVFCNGTERANADCFFLFVWVWTNFTDLTCPMFTSAGGPVSRGVSALADFNLHYQICTPDMRGSPAYGVDTMGNVSSGRLASAAFGAGGATQNGSKGNFLQPSSGPTNSAASFQLGTWYVKL